MIITNNNANVHRLRADMDDAQEKILHIDSWWKYFISLFGGVASNLRNIEGTLKNLLVDISVSNLLLFGEGFFLNVSVNSTTPM